MLLIQPFKSQRHVVFSFRGRLNEFLVFTGEYLAEKPRDLRSFFGDALNLLAID